MDVGQAMIATVRIAPAERWCKEALAHPDKRLQPGQEVQIDTSRVTLRNGLRQWRLLDLDDCYNICECMLEMD